MSQTLRAHEKQTLCCEGQGVGAQGQGAVQDRHRTACQQLEEKVEMNTCSKEASETLLMSGIREGKSAFQALANSSS